ncbi:MAG: fibronectin type III domain-containing protein [bacterium]
MKKKFGKLLGGKLLILTPIVLVVAFFLYFLIAYLLEQPINVKDLKISNISDGSATISYLTDVKTKGSVLVSTENSFSIFDAIKAPRFVDDRDNLTDSYTHHITVNGLTPDSKFYFRIAGNLRFAETAYPMITTFPTLDTLRVPSPSYAKFTTQDNDVLVFYTLNDSSLQSGVLTSDLSLTLDKSNIRTKIGDDIVAYKTGDTIKVDVVGKKANKLSFDVTIGQDEPFVTPVFDKIDQAVQSSLNPSVMGSVLAAAACDPNPHRECCSGGDAGKSKSVIVKTCDASGKATAWDVGGCDYTDPACTVEKKTIPNCDPGFSYVGNQCVVDATKAPDNTVKAPAAPGASAGTVATGNPLNVKSCPSGYPTVWTCQGNGRYHCDTAGGNVVSENCPNGCKANATGENDICLPVAVASGVTAAFPAGNVPDCTPKPDMPDETVIACAGGKADNFSKCENGRKTVTSGPLAGKGYWINCTGNSLEGTDLGCTYYKNPDSNNTKPVCLSDAKCKESGSNFVLNTVTGACEVNNALEVDSVCTAIIDGQTYTGNTANDRTCKSPAICQLNPANFGKIVTYNPSTKLCVEDTSKTLDAECTDPKTNLTGHYKETQYGPICLSDEICSKLDGNSTHVFLPTGGTSGAGKCGAPVTLKDNVTCGVKADQLDPNSETYQGSTKNGKCVSPKICSMQSVNGIATTLLPDGSCGVDKTAGTKPCWIEGVEGTQQKDDICNSDDICQKVTNKNSLAKMTGSTCVNPNDSTLVTKTCTAYVDKKPVQGNWNGKECISGPVCDAREKSPGHVVTTDGKCILSNTIVPLNLDKEPCNYDGKYDGTKNNVGENFGTATTPDCRGPHMCDLTKEVYVGGNCEHLQLQDGTTCPVGGTFGDGEWAGKACNNNASCAAKTAGYIFIKGYGCGPKSGFKNGDQCADSPNDLWFDGKCLNDAACAAANPATPYMTKTGCSATQPTTMLPGHNLINSANAQAVLGVTDSNGSVGVKVTETGTYKLGAITGYKTSVEEVRVVDLSGDNATIKFFVDTNRNGVKDEGESFVTDPLKVNLSKVNDNITYNLTTGWNLISFNLVSKSVTKASQLLNQVSAQGGYAINVSAYRSGKWVTYTQRAGVSIGTDFNLVPSEGYFVKVVKPTNLIIDGKLVEVNSPIFIGTGWNLIGLRTDIANASSLLKEINKSDNIQVDTLTKYASGRYENVVLDAGTVYGTEYTLDKQTGYFLRAKKGGASWVKK